MTPLLVLHAFGDERGGAPWRDALEADAWDGPWAAPDQPGHGAAPWETDFYEPAHLVIAPLRVLHQLAWVERPVVVGVREAATAAELLALGGRAAALVLVDAPVDNRPCDPDAVQAEEYSWLRRIADDPDAQPVPAPGAADPRLRLGLTPRRDPDHATRQRSAVPVPVLELEGSAPEAVLGAARSWWVRVSGDR